LKSYIIEIIDLTALKMKYYSLIFGSFLKINEFTPSPPPPPRIENEPFIKIIYP